VLHAGRASRDAERAAERDGAAHAEPGLAHDHAPARDAGGLGARY